MWMIAFANRNIAWMVRESLQSDPYKMLGICSNLSSAFKGNSQKLNLKTKEVLRSRWSFFFSSVSLEDAQENYCLTKDMWQQNSLAGLP
jgi:hypothetical protein